MEKSKGIFNKYRGRTWAYFLKVSPKSVPG